MRLKKSRFVLTSVMLLLTVSVGCNRTRKYPLQGEVVGKNIATNEITVKHGDIPGFMMAMAMPYRVKDPAVVQEVQPGDKIAAAFHSFKDVEKYARVVGLDEIAKNDFNLNINRYVETADAVVKVDVAAAIVKLRELEKRRSEAEGRMNGYLK